MSPRITNKQILKPRLTWSSSQSDDFKDRMNSVLLPSILRDGALRGVVNSKQTNTGYADNCGKSTQIVEVGRQGRIQAGRGGGE